MKPVAVARVEALLGGEAASWDAVISRGYAVGERWIVRLDDGRSAFVKVGIADWMAENMRAEMRVYSQLDAPFLPRVIAWIEEPPPLLVLEDLTDSEWPPPWTPERIDAVLATLDELAGVPPPRGLPPLDEKYDPDWEAIANDPEPFLSLGVVSREWLDEALPALRAAEAATAFAGDRLVHCDVRSDNLCIRGRRAILVDWNWAHIGNPLFDYAFWLPSLLLENGPPIDEMAARRPGTDAFAAFVAGFFGSRAGRPEPPTAPGVRRFQRAQLEVSLPWAARVLRLPPPDGTG